MAAMQVIEEDAKLATKCLELCQMLAGKSLTFSFSLTIGSSFSFSVDTRGKEVLATQKKKKTPSALRRDARRREELLKKKKLYASTENGSRSEEASAKEAEAPNKAPTMLKHHPSPPTSSERRQVVVVGRENVVPSFNQLDGHQEDVLCSSPSSAEVEEDIIDVLPDDPPLCETHKVPPPKVRHPDYDGIGTFLRINSDSGNFAYEFPDCPTWVAWVEL